MSDFSINSGVAGVLSNTTYDTSSTSALSSKLTSTDLSQASDDELMEVCKDFESYFIEQTMKAMEKMIPDDDDDDDSGSSYASQMSDYFKDELLAQYSDLAADSNDGQGLGIAQTLYEQMKRNYSTTE